MVERVRQKPISEPSDLVLGKAFVIWLIKALVSEVDSVII
jgi:hypothetical protein